MAGERFSRVLVGSFGRLAVFLATVGVYDVISYSVAQRVREIGLRIALGAQRGKIFRMIIRQAVRLSGVGIVIGVLAALGVGRVLSGYLLRNQRFRSADLCIGIRLACCRCHRGELSPRPPCCCHRSSGCSSQGVKPPCMRLLAYYRGFGR